MVAEPPGGWSRPNLVGAGVGSGTSDFRSRSHSKKWRLRNTGRKKRYLYIIFITKKQWFSVLFSQKIQQEPHYNRRLRLREPTDQKIDSGSALKMAAQVDKVPLDRGWGASWSEDPPAPPPATQTALAGSYRSSAAFAVSPEHNQ